MVKCWPLFLWAASTAYARTGGSNTRSALVRHEDVGRAFSLTPEAPAAPAASHAPAEEAGEGGALALVAAAKAAGLSVELLTRGATSFAAALGEHRPNEQCAGRMPGWPVGAPALLARPRSTEEVAQLVRLVGEHASAAHIAVRDQGHSYTCQSLGSPGAKGALMLDLSQMGGAARLASSADTAGALLHLVPGTSFADLVDVAKKQKLHVVHGDCPGVGAFGCYLHGCINIGGLSNAYGLGTDNIVGFTIVLMDGHVWNVSASSAVEVDPTNVRRLAPGIGSSSLVASAAAAAAADEAAERIKEDLWFAVRGAGSSFGVVTALTIRAHPGVEPPIRRATLQLAAAPATVAKAKGFGAERPEKAAAYVELLHGMRAVPEDWSVNVIATGGSQLTDGFENFWVELMDTQIGSPRPLEPVAATLLAALTQRGAKATWKTPFKEESVMRPPYSEVWGQGAVFASSGLVAPAPAADEVFSSFGDHITAATSGGLCDGCWANLHRVGAKHRDRARADGTALNPARANGEFYLEMDCGAQPAGWAKCENVLRATQTSLNSLSSAPSGGGKPWQYPNIANDYTSDWEDYAWGSNKARLTELKHKYDPQGRLTFFRSIGNTADARAP